MIKKKTKPDKYIIDADPVLLSAPLSASDMSVLTPDLTAIVNYFNKEYEKIDTQLKEIRRVLEQIRDEARQREKNQKD